MQYVLDINNIIELAFQGWFFVLEKTNILNNTMSKNKNGIKKMVDTDSTIINITANNNTILSHKKTETYISNVPV